MEAGAPRARPVYDDRVVSSASLDRAPPIALAAALLAGCSGPTYPAVDCHQPVWARASGPGATMEVVGSWDGWKTPGVSGSPADGGWMLALLQLPPGEYGYQVVVDGVAGLDPYQPLSTYRGEQEVSLLVAADCNTPAIQIGSANADGAGALSLDATFQAAAGGPPLDPAGVRVTIDGAEARGARVSAKPATGAFSVVASGLARGKHTVTVRARDAQGKEAAAKDAAVWVRPAAETWTDGVLYEIMIDRFRGDGGAPLAPPPTPGTRAGGTLGGVTAEIEKGTFDALGVTALWLTPVYTNPDDFRAGKDGHVSQAYHGYWPLACREVEPRFGGEAALDALVAAAHAHGLRVLFDIVPNQLYDRNPRFLDHGHDGWFNMASADCICGAPHCSWSGHIETCWFAPYLPDLRYQDDAAMHASMDDALFWMRRFDADGVRIDAVPMMPRAATRRILRAIRDDEGPRGARFAVGEIFTGPGQGGIDTIRYHLGPDGLDSAFDFPLMWQLRDTIADGGAGFDAVDQVLGETDTAYAGSGTVEARILDNHDTARFVSEANGDGARDGWTDPPPQPSSPAAYARQRLALGMIFALPGMPVLYYGDEVALAGANDPDARRVMPDPASLSEEQQQTLALARRLGTLRGCLKALRRGARSTVWVDTDHYAFVRDAGDGAPAVALFSRSEAPSTIAIPGGLVPGGSYVGAISGMTVSLSGEAEVPIDPMSFEILIPSNSPCR
jgi:glycosidase